MQNRTILEKLKDINWIFILLVGCVGCIGFAILYSAANGHVEPWAGKHIVRFIIGLLGLIAVALIDIRWWMKLAYPIYGVTLLLLIFVDIKGQIGMGAQRWINLGFMQLQPSELMKIAMILALARYFSSGGAEDLKNPLLLIKPVAAFVLLPVTLVLVQPDLGTAVMLMMVSAAMFFLAGVSIWLFTGAGVAGLASIPIGWHFLHDYQKKRVYTFLDPESDPLGSGYHITQSKIALGSGGLHGKGFLQGSQSHLNFLPEKQTDFVFTLFAEEWGLMGGLALLALFAAIIAIGTTVGLRAQSQFGRLLAMGIIINYSLYIFINIGMVMGLLPVVGVPLPMLSNGGTAMLSVLFGFGLLMSVWVHPDTRPGRGL